MDNKSQGAQSPRKRILNRKTTRSKGWGGYSLEEMERRCLLSAAIGLNLDGISDDSTIGAFNDLARFFRPWGRPGTPYQPDATIPRTNPSDPWPDNYPLEDAGAISYATTYPNGVYQVSYEGEGDVTFRGLGHAWFTVTSHVGNRWTGLLDLQKDANDSGILELHIKNVDPTNPIRNLKIISPDANPAMSNTFRPVFLNKLQGWTGPLRFMDWGQTNENALVSWSDRTTRDRFSYVTGNGVPLEDMIELANLTRRDVWINTPLHASDEYVRNMAALIRDTLSPDLKVYLENSNEVWNIQFQQSKDVLFEAHDEKEWRADGDPRHDAFLQGDDDFGLMAQIAARRMVKVVNLFRQQLGPTRSAALRPVFGSHIAVTYWAQKAMEYIGRRYGPPRDYIYSLAIAPYVGAQGEINPIDNDPNVPASPTNDPTNPLTMEKLFESMNAFIDGPLTGWIQSHKALADQYGLKVDSYEAGQSLQAQSGRNEALKVAAQDHPLMADMYRHLIDVWTANGGGVFGTFSLANHYSINGYWGLLDRIDRSTSAKWEAVRSFLPAGAPPVSGAEVSISGGLVGARGGVVHAFVSVDDAAGVGSFEFTLNYNTAVLDLTNADVSLTGLTAAGWTFVANVDDAAGKVRVTGYSLGEPLGIGGGAFLDLAFRVSATAPAGTVVLDIDDTGTPARTRLNEGTTPATFVDGTITVPIAATVTGAPPNPPEGTAITLAADLFGQTGAVNYLWHVVAANGQVIADSTTASFSFTPVDDGLYTVTLTVTDQGGGVGTATRAITVVNAAPVAAVVGAPATAVEGAGIALTATAADAGSADTRTYLWTVTKNGAAYATAATAGFSFTPDDDGTYVVTLTVTDDGGAAGTAEATVNVTNVAPVATIGGAPATSPEGTAIALTGSAADAGAADTLTYAWTVKKAGVELQSGSGAAFTFTPDDNGTYEVTLTVTDGDGGVATDVKTITVTNVAPWALIGGAPVSAVEGGAINLTATASDPGSADVLDYAWAVTKNGAAYAQGTGAAFSFTPDDEGVYAVTLTATDDDGVAGVVTKSVTVTNANPTAAVGGAPASAPEGTPIPLTGSAADAGAADTLAYAWSVTRNGVRYATATTANFSFTPDDDGTYVVTLTVTDGDGGTATETTTIAATNVAPVPTIAGAPATAAEGTVVSLTGSATDAGANDTRTFAWSVTKDGAAYTTGSGATFTFTPDDDGVYVVTLAATDNGRAAGTTTRTIAVTNVSPAPTITGAPATSPEGQAVTLAGSAADAGAADAVALAWSVTRGGTVVATGSGASFTFTPGEAGAYVVTLTGTDGDGGVGTASVTIQATAVTFRVTSLTPTASGFDLAFNHAVNFAALNLYRVESGLRGLADLVVVGEKQGPITGSIVYDAVRKVVTFVKTGGLLAADTYTVTVRSTPAGTDGLVDTLGNALDGDADGAAGDAYTGSFVVTPTSDRTIGLPDFTRGPGQAVSVPAVGTGLPIRVSDSAGLTSVSFTLTYDPALLSVTGLFAPVGWATSLTPDGPGRLLVTASGPALAAGLTAPFNLLASVPTGATYGASHLVVINDLSLNGGAIAARGDAALHQVAYLGDATGNGDYTGLDASDIARVTVGLDDGFAAFPHTDPTIVGDATGDGTLSSLDAHYVARKSVGLSQAQIPDLPAAPAAPLAAGGGGDSPAPAPAAPGAPAGVHLTIPAHLVARAGATVTVPVHISDFAGVRSLDLVIHYDTTHLDLANADVTLGGAAGGWTLVKNIDDSTGTLRLTLYRADAATGVPGTMLDLAFRIPQTAPSGALPLNLAGRADEGQVPLSSAAGAVVVDAVAPAVTHIRFDPNGGAHALTLRFGENVGPTLSLDDLTITHAGTGVPLDRAKLSLTYDARTNTATIRFPGYPGGIVADGQYAVTLDPAGVTDAAGNPLAAFAATFTQRLGDLNLDGVVDAADRAILDNALAAPGGGVVLTAAHGDANGDHVVDFSDLVALAQHFETSAAGGAEAGDFNGDGVVDFNDLVVLAQHFERDGRGDLNGDGLITQADADILASLLNPPPAAAPVAASPVRTPTTTTVTAVTAPTKLAAVTASLTTEVAGAPASAPAPASKFVRPVAEATPVPTAKPSSAKPSKTVAVRHPVKADPVLAPARPTFAFNPSKRIKRARMEAE
jgi:PKD repeat protein